MSLDAHRLRRLADELDQDPATSFTGDDAYGDLSELAEGAARLAEVATRKLAAVDHVRGARRKPKSPRIRL